MAIKAVLFDLDDTLLWDERSVQEAFEATCSAAFNKTGVQADVFEKAVRMEARALYETFDTYSFTRRIGINPFEALWANFSEGEDMNFKRLHELAPYYRSESWTRGLRAVGIDDRLLGESLGEQFAIERRARPIVYDETFQVLDQLQGQVKMLMLTNGSPDLQKEKVAAIPRLSTYFEHIVISGEFGQGKPAVEIFEHAMELLDIRADEGIMVGDKLTTDIKGALAVGMKAVWINRHQVQRSDEIVPDYTIRNLTEIFPLIQG